MSFVDVFVIVKGSTDCMFHQDEFVSAAVKDHQVFQSVEIKIDGGKLAVIDPACPGMFERCTSDFYGNVRIVFKSQVSLRKSGIG
ncbi:hypothetical protein D3C86_1275100 [compost metagenome]